MLKGCNCYFLGGKQMDFKKEFANLAKKYNLSYQYQDFHNCFGGNWWGLYA